MNSLNVDRKQDLKVKCTKLTTVFSPMNQCKIVKSLRSMGNDYRNRWATWRRRRHDAHICSVAIDINAISRAQSAENAIFAHGKFHNAFDFMHIQAKVTKMPPFSSYCVSEWVSVCVPTIYQDLRFFGADKNLEANRNKAINQTIETMKCF